MSKSKNVFKEGVENYSINLLWVNQKKDQEQKYIHKAQTQEELITKFLNPAIGWAIQNPTAEVNIWFDSKLHEQYSIDNTKEVLKKLAEEKGLNNVYFRDIREIKIVKENEALFHENMPLYYRIDFLKMIIALHSLKNESKDATIHADLEVCDGRPEGRKLNKEELFDKEYMKKLEAVGILVNKGIENQFIQLVNNDLAVGALRHAVNACLMRGEFILNSSEDFQKKTMEKMYTAPFYSTINEVYTLYKSLKLDDMEVRADIVKEGSKDEWIKYNPEVHKYEPLGNWVHPSSIGNFSYLDKQGKFVRLKDIFKTSVDSLEGDYILRRREDTETREGRAHIDKFSFPDKKFLPFQCKYWEEDQLPDLSSLNLPDEQKVSFIGNIEFQH